jgi:hypothetical protein
MDIEERIKSIEERIMYSDIDADSWKKTYNATDNDYNFMRILVAADSGDLKTVKYFSEKLQETRTDVWSV